MESETGSCNEAVCASRSLLEHEHSFSFCSRKPPPTAGLSPMDSWAVMCEETKLVGCWEGGEWWGQPPPAAGTGNKAVAEHPPNQLLKPRCPWSWWASWHHSVSPVSFFLLSTLYISNYNPEYLTSSSVMNSHVCL